MDVWERKAMQHVNKASSLVRYEQNRLYRELPPSAGRDFRQDELADILELLSLTSSHIDPHGEVPWEFQTPLPF